MYVYMHVRKLSNEVYELHGVFFIFLVGVNVAIIVCFFSLHDVNKPAYRGKEPPDGKLPPPPLTQSPPFHLTPPHPPSFPCLLSGKE